MAEILDVKQKKHSSLETENSVITAAILIIGDEILSGRTQDQNIQFLASWLSDMAIDLCEVRVVRDHESQMIDAIKTLSNHYDYLFTTGGIGPTHDDITADCVAKALDKPLDLHPEAYARLLAHYGEADFTPARQRMARVPQGGQIIDNPVSIAPGFEIENIFVMAGVPKIMQAMAATLTDRVRSGAKLYSDQLTLHIAESLIADELLGLQERHDGLTVGSYPFFDFEAKQGGVQAVLRSRDPAIIKAGLEDLKEIAEKLNIESE